jgi:hypothetical protein
MNGMHNTHIYTVHKEISFKVPDDLGSGTGGGGGHWWRNVNLSPADVSPNICSWTMRGVPWLICPCMNHPLPGGGGADVMSGL